MKRVRKAAIAALGAAVLTLVGALINGDQPATTQGWGALIGGAVAGGLATGYATYQIRNQGPGITPGVGSEPSRLYRRGDPV